MSKTAPVGGTYSERGIWRERSEARESGARVVRFIERKEIREMREVREVREVRGNREVKLDYYRVFYWVAFAGSITRGSAIAGCSHNTAKKAIVSIEESLGCELMYFNDGGIRMTKAGEDLADEIHRALRILRDARNKVSRMRRLVDGEISVAMDQAVFDEYEQTRDFNAGITKRILVTEAEEAVRAVEKGTYEMAVIKKSVALRGPLRCLRQEGFWVVANCRFPAGKATESYVNGLRRK